MRILVLGGTRFIGPYVVRCLIDAGHEVVLFNRGQTASDLPPVIKRIQGDRTSLASFRSRFTALAPEVIVDMCAYSEEDARSAMLAFRGIARRIVVISSMDVYRAWDRFFKRGPGLNLEPVPLGEDAALRDLLYPYRTKAESPSDWKFLYDKILVERVVMGDPELPATVLRLAAIYGPGDYRYRLFDITKRMDDQRPAILVDRNKAKWRWTWGYVENVAAAIAAAATNNRAERQIYNVGEKHASTHEEWIQNLASTTGWSGKLIFLDEDRLPGHLRESDPVDFAQDLELNTDKLGKDLAFTDPVPLRTALVRTVDWQRMCPPKEIDPKDYDYLAEDAVCPVQTK